MKLMIVDDSALMRAMIRKIVANPSDEVIECADGDEVLAAFKQSSPDYVLIDLQMLNVGGIEATRSLKKEYPGAKIIIVSNFREQEFRDEARDAGAISYFTKDDLIRVRQFISK